MSTTKVTRNFQITLPRDVRDLAGISIGDTLNVAADSKTGEVKITKTSPKEAVLNATGIWKPVKDSVSYVRSLRYEAEKSRRRKWKGF